MAAQLECYVYVVLPGSTEFVTAGRFSQSRDRQGQPVGTFVYGRRYRDHADAVELDPVQLKLRQGPFVSPAHVKVSIRGLAQQSQANGGSEIAD
jgi:serine/threonine-protein kinase HipA